MDVVGVVVATGQILNKLSYFIRQLKGASDRWQSLYDELCMLGYLLKLVEEIDTGTETTKDSAGNDVPVLEKCKSHVRRTVRAADALLKKYSRVEDDLTQRVLKRILRKFTNMGKDASFVVAEADVIRCVQDAKSAVSYLHCAFQRLILAEARSSQDNSLRQLASLEKEMVSLNKELAKNHKKTIKQIKSSVARDDIPRDSSSPRRQSKPATSYAAAPERPRRHRSNTDTKKLAPVENLNPSNIGSSQLDDKELQNQEPPQGEKSPLANDSRQPEITRGVKSVEPKGPNGKEIAHDIKFGGFTEGDSVGVEKSTQRSSHKPLNETLWELKNSPNAGSTALEHVKSKPGSRTLEPTDILRGKLGQQETSIRIARTLAVEFINPAHKVASVDFRKPSLLCVQQLTTFAYEDQTLTLSQPCEEAPNCNHLTIKVLGGSVEDDLLEKALITFPSAKHRDCGKIQYIEPGRGFQVGLYKKCDWECNHTLAKNSNNSATLSCIMPTIRFRGWFMEEIFDDKCSCRFDELDDSNDEDECESISDRSSEVESHQVYEGYISSDIDDERKSSEL